MLVMTHYHSKMTAVFCNEELDSENGISSFSLEQLAMCDNPTTVFSYDIEENNINGHQRQNVTTFIIQQCNLFLSSLVHAQWRYLNRQ